MRVAVSEVESPVLSFVAERPLSAVLADYVALTKPRLSGLVLFTMAGGMWLSGQSLPWTAWIFGLLGTAGTVGAANALNCWWERDSDKHMVRTATRPLPAQRMVPANAVKFAIALAVVSLPMTWVATNALTGFLGLIALLTYVFVYTPLKAKTHWAMQAGAIPGALPPLMGWTAATGKIGTPGLALFAILTLWQLPHFIAIALRRKQEYLNAGLTSLPLQKGDDTARLHAVLYLVALWPVSALPWVVHVAGPVYLVAALGLSTWFLAVGVQGWRAKGGEAWAKKLFFTSLIYLTILFAVLGVDGGVR